MSVLIHIISLAKHRDYYQSDIHVYVQSLLSLLEEKNTLFLHDFYDTTTLSSPK